MCKDATALFVFHVPTVVARDPVQAARATAPQRFPSYAVAPRGRHLAIVCTEQEAFDILAEFNARCTDRRHAAPRAGRVRPNSTASALANDMSGLAFTQREVTDLFNVFCSAVARHIMAESVRCVGIVDGSVMSALLRTAATRWSDAVMMRCAEFLSVVTVTRHGEVYAGVATSDRVIWRRPDNESSPWSAG